MANIKVNTDKLSSTANLVDDKLKSMKRKMTNANNQVQGLSAYWSGKDYTDFLSAWGKVSSQNSNYLKMIKSLESYSNYLKYAQRKYNNARRNAIDRSNRLPR